MTTSSDNPLPNSVSVIGAGSWGTALAITVAQNISRVKLWGRDAESMARMRTERCNQKYLGDIRLPDNIEVNDDFSSLIDPPLCFLIVVPSHAYRTTLESLRDEIINAGYDHTDATIVWGTKGFEPGTGRLLSTVTEDVFGNAGQHGIVSGPSFAIETAQFLPTAVTVASKQLQTAKTLSRWFHTSTTRAYHSDDPNGVQVGGAVKNVMAIAAGISDGLGYGANAQAALITRGLSELTRLGLKLNGRPETLMGLTGVGDLILTCTDNKSRNRRFGFGIGEGKSIQQVTQEIGQEIEGINTVKEVYMLGKQFQLDMPITEEVFRVLHQGDNPAEAVKRLLERAPKSESL